MNREVLWMTWSCCRLEGCALSRLSLHRGHDDSQRLGGLCGFGAQGTASGGVRVMRVMHRHTADHIGSLARSCAAEEMKEKQMSISSKTWGHMGFKT